MFIANSMNNTPKNIDGFFIIVSKLCSAIFYPVLHIVMKYKIHVIDIFFVEIFSGFLI